MNLELKQNIWKSDKNGLGFFCVNIFEYVQDSPSLIELLQNEILKEKEFGPIESMKKELIEPTNYYGSFLLNKISSSDFKTLNFNELESEITEYWKDEDWGEDLSVFKKNFELALSNLNGFDLSKRTFHFINAEKLELDKLTDPNFFTYLVCAISTEKESKKIITLTFGLD